MTKVIRHQVHKPDWARAFHLHGRRNKGFITRCGDQWRITHSYLTGYADTALATEYHSGTWHEAFIIYAAHDLMVVEQQYHHSWKTASLFMT